MQIEFQQQETVYAIPFDHTCLNAGMLCRDKLLRQKPKLHTSAYSEMSPGY